MSTPATPSTPSPSPPSQLPMTLLELFFMLSGGNRHTKLAPSDLATYIINAVHAGTDPTHEMVQTTVSFGIFAPDLLDALMPELKAALELDGVKELVLPAHEGERDATALSGEEGGDVDVDAVLFGEVFAEVFYVRLDGAFRFDLQHCAVGPESGNAPPAMLSALSIKLGFPNNMRDGQAHLKMAKMVLNLDSLQLEGDEKLTMPDKANLDGFAVVPLIMFAVLGVDRYARILEDRGAKYEEVLSGAQALRARIRDDACIRLLEAVLKDFAGEATEARRSYDVWRIMYPAFEAN